MRSARLTFYLFLVLASPASASPIVVGPDTFDVRFSLTTNLTLVAGQITYIQGTLENVGASAITFQTWNSAFPSGGYGWSFLQSGFAYASGGISFTAPINVRLSPGEVAWPEAGTGLPDFSHVSDAMIAPGDALTFTVFSLAVEAGVPVGTSGLFSTNAILWLGGDIGLGWRVSPFTIAWTVADAVELGNPIEQRLTVIEAVRPAPGPAPSALFLALALVLGVRRRRQ